MQRLDCPYCGLRDVDEFRHGGDAHAVRPDPGIDDAGWANYLFNQDNPKGPHRERWCHSDGCGQWFNVARDTATHEVLAVYRMGELPPDVSR